MAMSIQSPLSYYLHVGEALHKQNTEQRLKDLTSGVPIDREANAKTVGEYNRYRENADLLSKQIRAKKKARNWAIFGIIFTALTLSILFGVLDMMAAIKSMLIAFSILAAIVLICVTCKNVKAKINALNGQLAEQQRLSDTAYQQALTQMQAFNNAFPEDVSLRLVEKTMPILAFDSYFTAERLQQLQAYGLSGEIPTNESVVETLSGELYGKPFLYDRRIEHRMEEKTYHGSLTIHWTTESRDSKGNVITRHHSETLHAYLDKPYPNYYDATWLYYGTGTLPNLHFFRSPKFSDDKNKRELSRTLRKGERKLRRLEEKELRNGGDFIQVENTEFEILFGAENRSDELDFREMYTMQAQKNTVDLLLSDATYGDDFYYAKQGTLHKLQSAHRQGQPLYPSGSSFHSHDVVLAEQAFTQLNARFYKDVFFDFAPILAAPIFQSVEESRSITVGDKTQYNYEQYANAVSEQLRPEHCDTDCIFKVNNVEQEGDATLLHVTAYGYYGEPRVTYVSKHGGDGHWHDVPVDWVEYIPENKTSMVKIITTADGVDATVL